MKSSKNVQQELFTRKKNEETGTKRALDYFSMPKLQTKSSQQLPSCFIAMRDSSLCKMFSRLFCFKQEKTLKNFQKKLYIIKIKNKRRSRDEK